VAFTPRCPWGGFLEAGAGWVFGDPTWAFPGVVCWGGSEVGFTPRCPWGGFLETGPGYLFGDPSRALPEVGWLGWVGGGSSSG
jgi:hypothetical protein